MSTKTLIGIGLIFLFFVGGAFLGYYIKKCEPCPEVKDSVLVKGDTVWLSSDTTYIVKWKDIPAETDTAPSFIRDGDDTGWTVYSKDDFTKSSSIDSIFTSGLDAIRIQAEVKYDMETDVFDWLLNIEHKDFASHQTDTLKIYMTETIEVEIDNPLWIWSTIISIILLGLVIIF